MSKKTDFLNSIKNLSAAELEGRLEEDKLRLKKLKFAHTLTPLENPMSIRSLRSDIARVKTLIESKKA